MLNVKSPVAEMLKLDASVPESARLTASLSGSEAVKVSTTVLVAEFSAKLTPVEPVSVGPSFTSVTVTVTARVAWLTPSEATTLIE